MGTCCSYSTEDATELKRTEDATELKRTKDTTELQRTKLQRTEDATEFNTGDRPSISGQSPRRGHGFDDVILKVAEAISNDGDLRRLGLELGVKYPDINRALETNWAGGVKTSNGNVVMLQNWEMTVKPFKQLPTLRAALKEAGLLEVEETYLPRSPTCNSLIPLAIFLAFF